MSSASMELFYVTATVIIIGDDMFHRFWILRRVTKTSFLPFTEFWLFRIPILAAYFASFGPIS